MLRVRAAMPPDAAEVARVHVRSWQAGYRGLLSDEYLDGLRPEDRAARYTFGDTDPETPSTLVAVEDGVIRGFVTTGPCQDEDCPGRGEVLALYVDPDAWALGVGRGLIAEARAQLRHRGFTEAVLWVLAGNERARRFYCADGWVSDDNRQTRVIWGVEVDDIRYRRQL